MLDLLYIQTIICSYVSIFGYDIVSAAVLRHEITSVVSSSTFYAYHCDSLPLPAYAETVSHPKLTADPGVASSIPARSHTFVDIDHEKISTVILLPSARSFMKGCCQLQAKVCARITGYLLVQPCPGKKCG